MGKLKSNRLITKMSDVLRVLDNVRANVSDASSATMYIDVETMVSHDYSDATFRVTEPTGEQKISIIIERR